MGYVYLINEWGTDNYKIGVAKSVKQRKKPMDTANPHDLYVTREFVTDNPFKLEKLLHLHYNKYHNVREWFTLTDELVFDFVDVCKKYDEDLKYLIAENPFC